MCFPPNFLISNSQTPFPPIIAKIISHLGPSVFGPEKLMFVQGLLLGVWNFLFRGEVPKPKTATPNPNCFFSVSDLVSGAFFFYFKLGCLFEKNAYNQIQVIAAP